MPRGSLLPIVLALCPLACVRGGRDEIRIAVPHEVDTLDPHATLTISNFSTAANFYEPLVRTDADLEVAPCLARSWETPDPLTWIFHLEPSVRFHSGRPLTSADVVYTFERLLEHPDLQIGFFVSGVADVAALDPATVRIRTRRPLAALPSKLNFALIVPAGSGGGELAQREDGTGPYALEEWRRGEAVRLVRHEGYWGARPPVRRAEILLGRTPDQALGELLAGRCQLVQGSTRRLEEAVRSVHGLGALRHDSLFVKHLAFDLERDVTPYCSVRPNPFKSRVVRVALDQAIDRAALLARLPTGGVPATQPVPRFVFGFDPELRRPAPDPAAARALLAQAGLEAGFEVTLHARQILAGPAEAVREQLGRIGIRVRLGILSEPEFFRAFNARELTFFLSRWGSPTGDAGDILEDLFHSTDRGRGFGLRNYVGYANPDVDRAIEESGAILDARFRGPALQRAMSLLMEDLPWIPLYVDEEVYGLRDGYLWRPRADSYVLVREIGIRGRR